MTLLTIFCSLKDIDVVEADFFIRFSGAYVIKWVCLFSCFISVLFSCGGEDLGMFVFVLCGCVVLWPGFVFVRYVFELA